MNNFVHNMTHDSNICQRQAQIDHLLEHLHQQSRKEPQRAPFWRQGYWRCELHVDGTAARLKVFNRELCVHEEPIEPGPTAEARIRELKEKFVRLD